MHRERCRPSHHQLCGIARSPAQRWEKYQKECSRSWVLLKAPTLESSSTGAGTQHSVMKARNRTARATEEKTCGIAYLKPHPVPPRTIAATRMAPAMEPIIRLVALGPVIKDYGTSWEISV